MAPLKFEEKMKDKLEQRAIQPSGDSWERLTAQLDSAKKQKKENKKIQWYGIAAIFVGVLILTSILMNQNSVSEQNNTQFVDNSDEVIKNENTEIVENKDAEQKVIEKNNSKAFEESSTTDRIVTSSPEKENKNLKKKNIPSEIATPRDKATKKMLENREYDTELVENDKNTNRIKNKVLPVDSLIIEDKVAGVVAQIQELQKNNAQVTDDEINALLLEAQREISTAKILKSSTVSASSLLQDVEAELDETFKQRVFEALKTGFQKVKTAVVERDN
ncbi:hypothetical protein IWQ47_002791 [Aquimarina sp. EL_43]|uniref:hypothetical protein n=1 Tax=unclassified Aquimarina TaxID=2627091 RepID=UPI0018C99AA3|nr:MULTISPECIES: hypothetical protein [unclassified Aquimarina]MBG6131340.1 hypothetical protein [Aquimarina sp. EL_35]MBG6151777.1 hypothetical protein [Aquimarina sp. EL_32]MBG6169707.1 hypothetical protein [Aquimarina sp. EL_43]